MSNDKHKLHDRAMKLFQQISKRDARWCGLQYCEKGGIGPSKELDYLLKHRLVEIIRPQHPSRKISYLRVKHEKQGEN